MAELYKRIKLYGVVPARGGGSGYEIAEWFSIEEPTPEGVLHAYVDDAKAIAKVAELQGAK